MRSGFMKCALVGLASSVLLGCVKHDDSTFPNTPPPASSAPTTRYVVDSGLVTLSMDAVGSGPGAIGSFTPDAKELPDSTRDLPSSDLPGLGAPCADPVAGTGCQGKYSCFVVAATGQATCQDSTDRISLTGATCSPGGTDCRPGLFCPSGSCVSMCHVASPAECSGSGFCHTIGPVGSLFGYCE
jgi:hypothetical protein